MKISREIFKTFLESNDWTNEKTLNIFDKMEEEYKLQTDDLKKELNEMKFKYDDLKLIASDSLKNYDSSMKIVEDIKKKNKSLEKELKQKEEMYKEEIEYLKKASEGKKKKIKLEKSEIPILVSDNLDNIKKILPPIEKKLTKRIDNMTNNTLTIIKKEINMPQSLSYEDSERMRKDIIKLLEELILSTDNKQRCKQIILLFCKHKFYFVKKIGNQKYDNLLNSVNKHSSEKDYNNIFWSFFNEMAKNV